MQHYVNKHLMICQRMAKIPLAGASKGNTSSMSPALFKVLATEDTLLQGTTCPIELCLHSVPSRASGQACGQSISFSSKPKLHLCSINTDRRAGLESLIMSYVTCIGFKRFAYSCLANESQPSALYENKLNKKP